jgi:hypothetical protein
LHAWALARGSVTYENIIAERKWKLFSDLHGKVLELGPGAGVNLSYYSRNIQWIGIEPNPYNHPNIIKAAERCGLSNLEFRDLDGNRLEVADNIEHVAAPRGTLLRRIQSFVKPVWRLVLDGCCPDRETAAAIERAGFAKVNIENFRAPLPIVGPHIAGSALKR